MVYKNYFIIYMFKTKTRFINETKLKTSQYREATLEMRFTHTVYLRLVGKFLKLEEKKY